MDPKEKWLRRQAEKTLSAFKKSKIPAELLTLFRIVFAFIVAYVLFKNNYLYSIIFITIYQFVLLLDYIDGKLARHQKRFSISWIKFDFIFHYIVSFTFLIVITISNYLANSIIWIFYTGLIGSTLILVAGLFGSLKFKEIRMQRKGTYKGRLSWLYSFIGIENPFSLFYFLVIFNLINALIVIYTFLYLLIFLRKLI